MNFEKNSTTLAHEDVLDFVPDGVLIVDDNGTVTRANLAAAALLGYERHAVEGRGVLDFLPSFDWNLTRLPPHSGECGRPHAAGVRTTARTRDGGAFTAEISALPLDRDAFHVDIPDGSSLVVSLRNVTPAEEERAALSHALRQAEAVLRTASEALVGTDAEGRIDLVNPAAARLLQGKASDLAGRELLPLLTPLGDDGEPLDAQTAPWILAVATGRGSGLPGQVVRLPDGTRLTADIAARPVTEDGRVVGAVVALTDRRPYEELADAYLAARTRTARQHEAALARQEQRADRAVDHAHELAGFLSGPLTRALHHLHAETSRLAGDSARPLWPEAALGLDTLAAELRMTMALVSSRSRPYVPDGAPDEPRRRTVLIDDVVQAGMRAATAFGGTTHVEFSVHAPRFAVHVDPEDMTTAVGRLIAEAIHTDEDAAPREPRHVFVAALHRHSLLRIEVRGPYGGGVGEHLDVVQGIARAHGGTLHTHRAPGSGGSTYVLELPSAVRDDTVTDPGTTSPPTLRPAGRHRALTA
ncbi:PAS domain-containing protein [Streptomyces sp. NPDC002185]|uniref:PAS domain-containing protein n=1 Tax=Streptomyces sp. NPDC002185 TaxID=3364636 RepID=UPI00369505A5